MEGQVSVIGLDTVRGSKGQIESAGKTSAEGNTMWPTEDKMAGLAM